LRSSRASAVNRFELPVVTAADRAASMLVGLAAGFGAYAALRQGWNAGAAAVCAAELVVIVIQVLHWNRSRRSPRRWLETAPGGAITLRHAGGPALPAHLRPATRILGPSVYIDIDCGVSAVYPRTRCWITPLDVPRDMLRRWSIVLLAAEQAGNRDGSPVAVA
jgi:hypothetical protein